MEEHIFETIHDKINNHHRFLITSHIRLDGDAIGSEIALYYALRDTGKSACVVNDSPTPKIYQFMLPESGMYIYPHTLEERPEVVFVLDCPTIHRIGRIKELIHDEDALLINIDHHISNEYFGNVNLVSKEVCATGEIILNLLKHMHVNITPDIATAIYVAIVTDTGRFMHSNTTPEAHRAVAFLLEQGARQHDVSRNVYNANPYNLMQLNARVLNTIKLHSGNRIASICLTQQMLESTHVDPIDTHEFADIPASISGVSVGVLFREMPKPNWVKVSLRSRNGFDVNSIAKKFGGGGHKYAAGCELQGDISNVQRIILDELEKALQEKKD